MSYCNKCNDKQSIIISVMITELSDHVCGEDIVD